jgi:hypothetical protein
MSNAPHKLDRESGGCVCGSEWDTFWHACVTSVDDFGQAWLDAQLVNAKSWSMWPDDEPARDVWECSHGHDRCSRH